MSAFVCDFSFNSWSFLQQMHLLWNVPYPAYARDIQEFGENLKVNVRKKLIF